MSSDRPELWDEIPALRDKQPSIDGPDDALHFDDDDEYHEFIFRGDKYDMVEVAAEVQENVAALPETAASFTAAKVVDSAPSQAVPTEVFELAGAWPVPSFFSQGRQRSQKYVNPSHPNAHYYPSAYTECKCGALMVREETVRGNPAIQGEHEHADDCVRDWRLHARARLIEERRRVAKRCLYLGHDFTQVTDRVGFRRDSFAEEGVAIGINPITELKQRANVVQANTWARLLREYSTSEVADAYGCHREKVRRYVNDYSDANAADLYKYRRNHD